MKCVVVGVGICSLCMVLCGCSYYFKKDDVMMRADDLCALIHADKQSFDDVIKLFPKTPEHVTGYAQMMLDREKEKLRVVLHNESGTRTFENTIEELDVIRHEMCVVAELLSVMEMVHPDKAMRESCRDAFLTMQQFLVDAFHDKALYDVCQDYCKQHRKEIETLDHESTLLLNELMREFKRDGLHLPADVLKDVIQLRKELAELSMTFESHIAQDQSSIVVAEDDIHGVSDAFRNGLVRDDQGRYRVRCDMPSMLEIMEHCSVEETRKRFYFAYNQRAYPVNETILLQLLEKRKKLATLLGFKDYAHFQIDDTMAKSQDRVRTFLQDMIDRAKEKAHNEMQTWCEHLPAGVVCEGNVCEPWSFAFIKNYYKKTRLSIDEHELATYFPVDSTLQGVFDVYQKFLGLSFALAKPSWSWHESVEYITITDKKTGSLLGYIMLDLYPRENKYTHACMAGLLPSLMRKGIRLPATALIIANFPKSDGGRPALLKFNDVVTFFHEFGHAIHHVLGATKYAAFAGTSVKSDFVEMPSQMFEEWMYDDAILKQVSSHVETGAPLPDHIIQNMRALKHFDAGTFVVRQACLSLYALTLHEKDEHPADCWATLSQRYMPFLQYHPTARAYASFGHLASDLYASKYYNYLWAKVFALDVFYEIKKSGLLNASVGHVLRDGILGKGGSVEPEILLKNFLGREPQSDAFFKDMGI